MARYTSWLAHMYQTEADPVGKQIIVGKAAPDVKGYICMYGPDERSECPFCNRVFAHHDELIDHLLRSRRNHDSSDMQSSTYSISTTSDNINSEKSPHDEDGSTMTLNVFSERTDGSARKQGLSPLTIFGISSIKLFCLSTR